MIDMLLLDVLCTRKDYKAWCEVPLKTEAVAGIMDYAVCKISTRMKPQKPFVVVLEVKMWWV